MKFVLLLFGFAIILVDLGEIVEAQRTRPGRRPVIQPDTDLIDVEDLDENDDEDVTTSDCYTAVYFAQLRCQQTCEDEKNVMRAEKKELDTRIFTLQRENTRLTSEKADLESELQQSETELQEQRKVNEKLQNDTKMAENEYNKLINSLKEKVSKWKRKIRNNLTESREENEELKARIEKISKQKAEMAEQLNKQIGALKLLEEELTNVKKEKREAREQVSALQSLNEEQNFRLDTTALELDEQQKNATRAIRRAAECTARKTIVENELLNERATAKLLQKEKKNLQNSNSALWLDIDDCSKDKTHYQNQTLILNNALEESELKMTSVQAAYTQVVEVEMVRLAQQNEILHNASFMCNIRCDNLEEENLNITQSLEVHRERIEDLQAVYDEIHNVKLVNLNESLQRCEHDLNRAEGRIEKLKLMKNVLELDLEECLSIYNSSVVDYLLLEEENNRTKQLYKEAQITLAVAEQTYQALDRIGIFEPEICQTFNSTDSDIAKMLAVEAKVYSSQVGENDDVEAWPLSIAHDAQIMLEKSTLIMEPSYPDYIQRFLNNEFQKFLLRVEERLCYRCVHGSNCTLVPFDELYSATDLNGTIEYLEKLLQYNIYKAKFGYYVDLGNGKFGATALKPIEYKFLAEIWTELTKYAWGKIPLSDLSKRFIRCICRQHTFSDTCSVIEFNGNAEELI